MANLPEPLKNRIESAVKQAPVVLFMKGNRAQPRCGFSAQVVGILNEVLPDYATVDILADQELREGLKIYSDWPTYPQLYVRGELVGGCDIIKEMHASGALFETLGVQAPTPVQPKVTITEAAAGRLRQALEDGAGQVLRLNIDSAFRHDLYLGEAGPRDARVESGGVTLHLDATSSRRAEGLRIDFLDNGLSGAGFKIDNPNAPPA